MESTLPLIGAAEAHRRRYLTASALARMHLEPCRGPVGISENGEQYFDPRAVREAAVETWYGGAKEAKAEKPARPKPQKNADGSLPKLSLKRAAQMRCFTAAALRDMYYEPAGDPVALFLRRDGTEVPLYDRDLCTRLPLPCVSCGATPRYRAKLCRACFEKERAARRAAGDAKRAAYYGFDPSEVLYFDLELTGVYEHDEVLSVSIVNGRGEVVFDSLVRPEHTKRWKRTEAIHGITPEMVKDAPTLRDLAPALRALVDGAARTVAYGTHTDFQHLSRIYPTRAARDAFHGKLRDCEVEFCRYIDEYGVELAHRSLSDAMTYFDLAWNGTAHTAIADAFACRAVFERLFPHYYQKEER